MNDHSFFMRRPPASLGDIERKSALRPAKVQAKKTTGQRVKNPGRVEARVFQIGKAALELFENKGYHATTISDIAKRAGLSVGTIYQYAPDKEGVLKLVLMDILDAYAREIPKALEGVDDPLLALREAIRSYCGVVAVRHRAGLLGYQEGKALKPGHQKLMMERELETNRLVSECIERCIEAGDFRPMNVELMTYRIILIAHGWALKAWHLHKITDLDTYVADNIEFIFCGALTKAGRRRYKALGFELPAQ
ncbi:MAG: TetR/AcrR family transcriptional regulator [Zoogloea oleivorans]|jgi:AcrR family transcriptional regulator|uniref:TetR/AcrR family transcriptional regulator n=1 Tax=Zoogloea oleivorans TaxID=1552750 RepID=UPI002A366661|nr:TetR/AcrR family transcriptional regulator [Zoogloea oleivorans]MDY0038299.1 TetR/AcrR family transcriptional regulator [Zoogloea oleivorans]